MVKHYYNFNIEKKHRGSIILIGNFDGLHRGHQKLFKLAQSYKKKYNLKIGVINFNPMPKMFFNKKLKNFRLLSINQKIKLLSTFKVDFVITKKFDKKFSKTKPIKFIKEILNEKLNSKFIFVSNNFRFGNKREGNVNFLIKNEKTFNYKVVNNSLLIEKKINKTLKFSQDYHDLVETIWNKKERVEIKSIVNRLLIEVVLKSGEKVYYATNFDIEYNKDFNRIKTKNSKSDLFIVINNPNISLAF